jgi:hypothetical protein
VQAWTGLLPAASEVAPEAWVVSYLMPVEARTERAIPDASLRVAGNAYVVGESTAVGGAIDGRFTEGRIGMLLRGWLYQEKREVPPSIPEFSSLWLQTGALELAGGPQWRGPGGAEVLPHVGPTLYSGAFSKRSARELADAGYSMSPATLGFGWQLGALGLHPFRAGGPLLASWKVNGLFGYSWTLRRPLDRSRPVAPEEHLDQQFPLDVWVRVEPGLEWRPAGGMLLGLGLPLSWSRSLGDPHSDLLCGASASVGWTL